MSDDELTADCQNEFSTAGLLTALESGWSAIRTNHPEVPEVVIVVGSGSPARASGSMKWGHFASSQWQRGTDRLPEVLVSGEGLSRPVTEVFTTLLHEATHGLAFARGIADTSRQGRWHNKKFATLAGEVGLTASQSDKLGWSPCTLNPVTQVWYADTLTVLAAAMRAYRYPDTIGGPGSQRPKTSKTVVLECSCPRTIRATTATVAEGPIVCGVCESPFTDDEGR